MSVKNTILQWINQFHKLPSKKHITELRSSLSLIKLSAKDVIDTLENEEGLTQEETSNMVIEITSKNNLLSSIDKHKQANKDILRGAVTLGLGLILTLLGFVMYSNSNDIRMHKIGNGSL